MPMFTKKSNYRIMVAAKRIVHLSIAATALAIAAACSFKFEITSQRTALENQVMGSYKEIDDDVILMSSVRGVDQDGKTTSHEVSDNQLAAVRAKQNQEFNRDDLDELKAAQIIGEAPDGTITVLPAGVGSAEKAPPPQLSFARALIAEENRDRQSIWRRIVQSNHSLTEKDLPEVRRTFARMQFDSGQPGHWFQDDNGNWQQKKATPVKAQGSSK